MESKDRFLRMAELECMVGELTERGWSVQKIVYQDEEGEPFAALIELYIDPLDHERFVV